jgi:putative oxidoreductase
MKTTLTSRDLALALTRVILAFVMAAHGAQKLLGWFGGYGFDGTMNFFTATIGLPYVLGVLIILTETAGMVALAVGFFSRGLAGATIAIMLGAIFSLHFPNGFFMNWGGTISGEGYEYHVLMIALALPTLIQGGGLLSLDQFIFKRKKSDAATR